MQGETYGKDQGQHATDVKELSEKLRKEANFIMLQMMQQVKSTTADTHNHLYKSTSALFSDLRSLQGSVDEFSRQQPILAEQIKHSIEISSQKHAKQNLIAQQMYIEQIFDRGVSVLKV